LSGSSARRPFLALSVVGAAVHPRANWDLPLHRCRRIDRSDVPKTLAHGRARQLRLKRIRCSYPITGEQTWMEALTPTR